MWFTEKAICVNHSWGWAVVYWGGGGGVKAPEVFTKLNQIPSSGEKKSVTT
jgi:hypothetical protein